MKQIMTVGLHLGVLVMACLVHFSGRGQSYESDFRKRSQIIIQKTADFYTPPQPTIGDPEKYYWPLVMARFEKYGPHDSIGNYWITRFKDNSPFHFTLAGMARMMSRYSDAPALLKHKIQLLQKVFERNDGYNPWTAEGTENHINMSRTSGYLFAQHALQYPDQFPQARQRMQAMDQWIRKWAKQTYTSGTAEWNSSIYGAYNILGWLNVYDFSLDLEIKAIAKAVLDYYVTELALHYSFGALGGSEMRGSGAGQALGSATNYLCWLWFGEATERDPYDGKGNEYIQGMHAITSTYRPPQLAVQLARKQQSSTTLYRGSKPSYGHEEPSFIKQLFYVHPSYTLGSSVNAYGGWTGSTNQMVNWKLVIKPDTGSFPYEISGNGRYYDNWTGKTRNPWTQLVQHKNILIQLTKTPVNADALRKEAEAIVTQWGKDWERDFRKRFPMDTHKQSIVTLGGKVINLNESYLSFPKPAQIQHQGHACFLQWGNTYVAVQLISETKVSQAVATPEKRLAILDHAPVGQLCGFVLEIASQGEYASIAEFQAAILQKTVLDKRKLKENRIQYTSLAGEQIEVQFIEKGTSMEATVDWGYGVTEPANWLSYPQFHQPQWPTGAGWGRVAQWTVNRKRVTLTEPWPVFEGPNIILRRQVLELKDATQSYRVDFTKEAPVFTSFPNTKAE
jgi:hypothetical protein